MLIDLYIALYRAIEFDIDQFLVNIERLLSTDKDGQPKDPVWTGFLCTFCQDRVLNWVIDSHGVVFNC